MSRQLPADRGTPIWIMMLVNVGRDTPTKYLFSFSNTAIDPLRNFRTISNSKHPGFIGAKHKHFCVRLRLCACTREFPKFVTFNKQANSNFAITLAIYANSLNIEMKNVTNIWSVLNLCIEVLHDIIIRLVYSENILFIHVFRQKCQFYTMNDLDLGSWNFRMQVQVAGIHCDHIPLT